MIEVGDKFYRQATDTVYKVIDIGEGDVAPIFVEWEKDNGNAGRGHASVEWLEDNTIPMNETEFDKHKQKLDV